MQAIGKFGAVFRTNSGSVRLPNGKSFRGLPKGFSDCMLVRPGGKVYFIETKVKPNKPTEEQTAFNPSDPAECRRCHIKANTAPDSSRDDVQNLQEPQPCTQDHDTTAAGLLSNERSHT
jgi:hypothetical protein